MFLFCLKLHLIYVYCLSQVVSCIAESRIHKRIMISAIYTVAVVASLSFVREAPTMSSKYPLHRPSKPCFSTLFHRFPSPLPPPPQLEEHITTVDLEALGDELVAAGQELPPSERTVATRLRNQAIIIKAQQRVVNGMKNIIQDIRVSGSPAHIHYPG